MAALLAFLAVPYSTSDGEPIPTLTSGFQFWTFTGLMGFLRRIYGDRSGTVVSPTFTFGAWQGSGMSVDDVTGAIRLSSVGVLGLQCDPTGRVGLGMAPVAGYGASVSGDLNLSGGSRTIAATSGSFLQIQAPTTVRQSSPSEVRVKSSEKSNCPGVGAGVPPSVGGGSVPPSPGGVAPASTVRNTRMALPESLAVGAIP